MKPSLAKKVLPALLSFILPVSLFTFLESCDTTEPSPKNDLQLLFGKNWQLTSETVSPGYILSYDSIITNPIAQNRIASCLLDNTYQYDSNGTWMQNGGTAKCFNSELPVVTRGTWSVNSTVTTILLTATYADSGISNDTTYYSGLLGVPETLGIEEISPDTLKLLTLRMDRDSLGYRYRDTVTTVYTLP